MAQSQRPARRFGPWPIFILIVLILVIIWIFITRRNETPTATEPDPNFITNVLSPAPAPIIVSNDMIVFQDNFDQTVGAWELSPVGQAAYTTGVMYLNDSHIEGVAWARPHLRFQDFILDIDSRWLGGSVGGNYGIHFRMQDSGEFLGFYVRNDGRFRIVQNGTGNESTLYEAFSPAISHAGEANHLRVEANGNTFRFFVNGGYLVDLQVAAGSAGDIMLVAEKAEGTETFQVGFDNLIVTLHPGSAPVP